MRHESFEFPLLCSLISTGLVTRCGPLASTQTFGEFPFQRLFYLPTHDRLICGYRSGYWYYLQPYDTVYRRDLRISQIRRNTRAWKAGMQSSPRDELFCLPRYDSRAGYMWCDGSKKCVGRYGRQYRRVLLSTRTRLRSRMHGGLQLYHTQSINRQVLQSQLPHKIVNSKSLNKLSNNKLTILWGG